MPYFLEIDDIHENLFILQNLCFASQSFCKNTRTGRYAGDEESAAWDHYFGWLKSIVSNRLITCAVKMRLLEDILRRHAEDTNLACLEEEATAGLVFAKFPGDVPGASLREACNKIIHATEVSLTWKRLRGEKDLEFWTGIVLLEGDKRGNQWKVVLYVNEFCTALDRLLSALEESVDWYHLYKHDS